MANLSSLIAPSGVLTAGADISELTNDAGYASQSDIDASIANFAEGASGAPKIENAALQGLFLGNLFSIGSNPVGFNDLGNFEQLVFKGHFSKRSSDDGSQAKIRFSTDNGATFDSFQDLLNQGTSGFLQGLIVVSKSDSTMFFQGLYVNAFQTGFEDPLYRENKTLTIPAGANAFQLKSGGGSLSLSAQIFMTGGA